VNVLQPDSGPIWGVDSNVFYNCRAMALNYKKGTIESDINVQGENATNAKYLIGQLLGLRNYLHKDEKERLLQHILKLEILFWNI